MATNKAAVTAIMITQPPSQVKDSAAKVVSILVDKGFLEADVLTEPERFAQAAYNWLGNISPSAAFHNAVGWSTNGWETVLGESLSHNLDKIRIVFEALVIMAKNAGKEL